MKPTPRLCRELWIIGYGNRHRRDDGIGPRVIDRLADPLKGLSWVRTASPVFPDPLLALQMAGAGGIVFVDASAEHLGASHSWTEIRPATGFETGWTHHPGPALFLSVLQRCFQTRPPAWLLAVQGFDFGLGDELSPGAEASVADTLPAIVAFVAQNQCSDFSGNPVPFHRGV